MIAKPKQPQKQNRRFPLSNRIWGYSLIALGMLFIIWPLLFITETKQYYECLAYDLFPNYGGYPSDSTMSFFYFVLIPSVLAGGLCVASGIARLYNIFVSKYLPLIFGAGVMIGTASIFAFLTFSFNLEHGACNNYKKDQLPDLPLIINSSNK